MKNKKAFTLIELLATIVVLAIIAVIGYMAVGNVITSTKVSTEQSSIKEYARAIEDARYNYLALEGVDIYKNISIPQSWLTENVKTGGNQVKCYQVNYQSGFHLVGCKVGNGNDLYCYKDNEFYDCTNNVENVITRVYGNSVQNGIPNYDNHVEIQSVGDKTINIFDISKTVNSNLVNNGDVTYNLTKHSTSQRFSEEVYVDIPANTVFYVSGKILEYTGTYSQKLQLTAHCTDGTTKYLNFSTDNLFKTFTYTCDIDKMRFYLDASNADGTKVTFKDFIIAFGNTEEEYEPYGKYKIPIKVSGKNLFDKEKAELGKNINAETGTLYNTSVRGVSDYIEIKPNKEYSLVYNAAFPAHRYLAVYDKDKNYLGGSNVAYTKVSGDGNTAMTIKIISDDAKYIRANFYWNADGIESELNEFIIYEGSGNDLFEPYVEPIIANIYLDEPLRKVGEYADYIDFENKKEVRKTKELILTGNESYTLLDVGKTSARVFTVLNDKNSTANSGFCSNFKTVSNVQNSVSSCDFASNYFRVNVSNMNISAVAEWTNYLKNQYNNGKTVKIVYVLNKEITESIDVPDIFTASGNVSYSVGTSTTSSKICYLKNDKDC